MSSSSSNGKSSSQKQTFEGDPMREHLSITSNDSLGKSPQDNKNNNNNSSFQQPIWPHSTKETNNDNDNKNNSVTNASSSSSPVSLTRNHNNNNNSKSFNSSNTDVVTEAASRSDTSIYKLNSSDGEFVNEPHGSSPSKEDRHLNAAHYFSKDDDDDDDSAVLSRPRALIRQPSNEDSDNEDNNNNSSSSPPADVSPAPKAAPSSSSSGANTKPKRRITNATCAVQETIQTVHSIVSGTFSSVSSFFHQEASKYRPKSCMKNSACTTEQQQQEDQQVCHDGKNGTTPPRSISPSKKCVKFKCKGDKFTVGAAAEGGDENLLIGSMVHTQTTSSPQSISQNNKLNSSTSSSNPSEDKKKPFSFLSMFVCKGGLCAPVSSVQLHQDPSSASTTARSATAPPVSSFQQFIDTPPVSSSVNNSNTNNNIGVKTGNKLATLQTSLLAIQDPNNNAEANGNNDNNQDVMINHRSDSCTVDTFAASTTNDAALKRLEHEVDYERVCMENECLFALQQLVELYKRDAEKIHREALWDPNAAGSPTEKQVENMSLYVYKKMSAIAHQQFRVIFPKGVKKLKPNACAQRVYAFLLIDVVLADDEMDSIAMPMLPGIRLSAANCPPPRLPWLFALLSFKATKTFWANHPERLEALRKRVSGIGIEDSYKDDEMVFDDPISWSIVGLRHVARIQGCLPHFVRRQDVFYQELSKMEKQISKTSSAYHLDDDKHPIIHHHQSSTNNNSNNTSVPVSPSSYSKSKLPSFAVTSFDEEDDGKNDANDQNNSHFNVNGGSNTLNFKMSEDKNQEGENNNIKELETSSNTGHLSPFGNSNSSTNNHIKSGMTSLACLRRTPTSRRASRRSSLIPENVSQQTSSSSVVPISSSLEDPSQKMIDEQNLVVVDHNNQVQGRASGAHLNQLVADYENSFRPGGNDNGDQSITELALHGKIDDGESLNGKNGRNGGLSRQSSDNTSDGSYLMGGTNNNNTSAASETSTKSFQSDNTAAPMSSNNNITDSSGSVIIGKEENDSNEEDNNTNNNNNSIEKRQRLRREADKNKTHSSSTSKQQQSTSVSSPLSSSLTTRKEEPDDEMLLLVTREKIGSGATGDVFSATCMNTGRLLALKEMHIRDVSRHGARHNNNNNNDDEQQQRDRKSNKHSSPLHPYQERVAKDSSSNNSGNNNKQSEGGEDSDSNPMNSGRKEITTTTNNTRNNINSSSSSEETYEQPDPNRSFDGPEPEPHLRNTMSARFSELNRSFSDDTTLTTSDGDEFEDNDDDDDNDSTQLEDDDLSDNENDKKKSRRDNNNNSNNSKTRLTKGSLETDYYQTSHGNPNASDPFLPFPSPKKSKTNKRRLSRGSTASSISSSGDSEILEEGDALELLGTQSGSAAFTLGGSSSNIMAISRDAETEFKKGCGHCEDCVREQRLFVASNMTNNNSITNNSSTTGVSSPLSTSSQQQNKNLPVGGEKPSAQINTSGEDETSSQATTQKQQSTDTFDPKQQQQQQASTTNNNTKNNDHSSSTNNNNKNNQQQLQLQASHHHHHRHQAPVITEEEQRIVDEISTLKRMRHENIISYYGARWDRSRGIVYIAMELANRSLRQLIERTQVNLPLRLIAVYARGILQGLAYLHENHIIHRDIKAANILVTDSGVIKVSDFGLSVCVDVDESTTNDEDGENTSNLMNEPQRDSYGALVNNNKQQQPRYSQAQWKRLRQLCGTPQFLSNEIFTGALPSEQSDIWSFGCTMIELVSGNCPWWNYESNSLWEIYARLKRGETPVLPFADRPDITPEFKDFVESCLQLDALKRPSAKELLAHPFLCVLRRTGSSTPGDF